MRPKKSKVWKYFDSLPNAGQCQLCSEVVASKGGNTSNLAAHLRRKHKIEVQPHPTISGMLLSAGLSSQSKTSELDTEAVPSTSGQSSQHASSTASADSGHATTATKEKEPLNIFQRAKLVKLPEKANGEYTHRLTDWIVHTLQPFSAVDHPKFRAFVKGLEPRYNLPSRQLVSQQLIPAWYNAEKEKLRRTLEGVEFVGLTSDGWTSRTTDPYLTVTVHFLQNWELVAKVIETVKMFGSHTGENLSVELDDHIKHWGLQNKVVAMTIDNAANMGKGVELSATIPLKIPCFAHTIALASRKADEHASRMLAKVRPTIGFFHRSHVGAQILKEKQDALAFPAHRLIMDVKTRWNSTFLMVERYLEQRVPIMAALADPRLSGNETRRLSADLVDADALALEDYAEVMKPMFQVTVLMSSESWPTLSLVLPLLNKIKKKFKPNDQDNRFKKGLKQAVLRNLETRYGQEELLQLLEIATLLDPRTKDAACISEAASDQLLEHLTEIKANQVVDQNDTSGATSSNSLAPQGSPAVKRKKLCLLEDILGEEESDDNCLVNEESATPEPASTRHMAEVELEHYKTIKTAMDMDPFSFWKINESNLPGLSKLAHRFLVPQATSVASERVFSTTGDIVSAERNRIDPELVNELVFLKKNTE